MSHPSPGLYSRVREDIPSGECYCTILFNEYNFIRLLDTSSNIRDECVSFFGEH